MQLSRALRVRIGESIAFVGAGGKTSALFTLASEICQSGLPVVITTTTHMSAAQTLMGDRRWSPSTRSEFEAIKPEILTGGVHVILRSTCDGEKVGGLPEDVLLDVRDFCKKNNVTLLIEADGSKMLPIKAPAAHEPVIPTWVDKVVVCTGLSGLGSPIDTEHVHRPEIFANLTGAEPGSKLTIDDIKRELLSDDGGLKNIPNRAGRITLFNQADTPALQASVQPITQELLKSYQGVVVSKSSGKDPRGFMHLEALSVQEKCAGIILAAGKASRMGERSEVKQLLDWHGKPFIWHIVQAALRAELDPVCVVTGSDGEKVANALLGLPVIIAPNPNWEKGQSASVRAGVEALDKTIGSAIFLMSDQPQIEPLLIESLVEKHSQSLSPVVAPLIDGRRGNPVLFDQITFADLTKLQGDTGGRAIFSNYQITWLPWSDARMLMDVDTSEDYQKLLRMDEE